MYFIPFLFCIFWFLFRRYYNTYYISIALPFIIALVYLLFLNSCLNYELLSSFITNRTNTLLNNNINKYHPLILHICLNFLIIFYIKQVEPINKAKYLYATLTLFATYLLVFTLCLFTMSLGS